MIPTLKFFGTQPKRGAASAGGGDEERRQEGECPPGHILSDADADADYAARSRREGAGDVAAGKQPPDVFAKRTRDPAPTPTVSN